jgi:Fur family peroxide stress response transcriptional regulator
MTPQRMAVLKVLIGNEEHLNVDQVYERVRPDFPMISIATIYKTISMLKEMGEVIELDLNSDKKHYDGHGPTPHPHLICTQCNDIIDIEESNLNSLSQDVAQNTGYEIKNIQVNLYGICPQCQE